MRVKMSMVKCFVRRAVLGASCGVLLAPAVASAAAPPAYYPSGPQVNIARSALTGWQVCHQSNYNETNLPLATILAACDGEYLLMAGGPVGSPNFDVLAAAPRVDVLTDTGTGNTPHDANGSGWYYNGDWSWGFAPQGAPITRNSCDTVDSNTIPSPGGLGDQRLCWHTGAGNGCTTQTLCSGWRSGRNDFLQDAATHERFIYEPAAVVVAGPQCDLTLGPVGCWGFDELSGTVAADATANANNGAYKNAPTLGAPGVFNKAVSMDGVNDYVQVADSNSLDVGNSVTLEAWVKRAGVAHTIELFNKGASAFQLVVQGAAAGNRVLFRKANVSSIAQSIGGVPADGHFHQIIATKSGATVHIYIDGVEGTTPISAVQVLASNAQPLFFSGTNGSGVVDGDLDAFAIYPYALTPVQVAARHAAGGAY